MARRARVTGGGEAPASRGGGRLILPRAARRLAIAARERKKIGARDRFASLSWISELTLFEQLQR
jgi:hypothetical protein